MTEPFLPANQPRYAMGLGTPAQMVELVARGVDMFDCVLPTRVARNGTAFTRKGTHQHQGRRLQGGLPARSRRAAIASPAGISRAPICGTCSTWTKSSACGC